MRVTKEKAQLVADIMTATTKEAIAKKNDDMRVMIEKIYESKIPKEVMKAFTSHKDWFEKVYSISVTGVGIPGWHTIYPKVSLPKADKTSLVLESEDADKFWRMFEDYQDLKSKKRKLFNDITITLYNMRTYNNVEKQWPEAFEHLPKEGTSTALAIPVKELLARVEQQP